MEWEEELRKKVVSFRESGAEYIYEICMNAFKEGSSREKTLAIEAHRLRCKSLFGNMCMDSSLKHCKKTCDSNCYYIKSYEFELFKLES